VLRTRGRSCDAATVLVRPGGTWAVVHAWGSLAGMTGAGPLVGDTIDNGILDHYRGTVTFR
jgi:hypothetical protein